MRHPDGSMLVQLTPFPFFNWPTASMAAALAWAKAGKAVAAFAPLISATTPAARVFKSAPNGTRHAEHVVRHDAAPVDAQLPVGGGVGAGVGAGVGGILASQNEKTDSCIRGRSPFQT